MSKKSSWNQAGKWYSQCVQEEGHYYHKSVILPSSLKLLDLKKGESLLDLGCGQGVLFRHLPKGIEYLGIDGSEKLIQEAKRLSPSADFHVADVTEALPIEKKDFDVACFILSLQNMEFPERAIGNAARHLKKGGRLLIILNHPCFRIPRQSHWGMDESAKIQYRRLNLYMSPLEIPIQVQPGRNTTTTFSYHFPLSSITHWLNQEHLAITAMEEWCSDKKSEGSCAKMEDRARREFPLFLAILAKILN